MTKAGRNGSWAIDARRGFATLGVLALGMTLALFAGSAEAKKKGTKFEESVIVNAPVPDNVTGATSTPVTSEVKVPKRFKGKVVGDLNVTGIAATGLVAGGSQDLVFKLTAPNGRTMELFRNLQGTSMGPLTLDDDTRTALCELTTPDCADPDQSLVQPYAGTASMLGLGSDGTGPLSSFNGIRMRGTWTLTVFDVTNPGQTSVLNGWGLEIRAAKPVSGESDKNTKRFEASQPVNALIPDDAPTGPSAPLLSEIKVPKKFKGKVVGDVNVTGIQTTGSAAGAGGDLTLKLTGPSGRTVVLFRFLAGISIGPLTLDDDTPVSLCISSTPPGDDDPLRTLGPPYAGTANKFFVRDQGTGPLSTFDGIKMRGTWTLTAIDTNPPRTSSLNGWGLEIRPAKPTQEEEK